MKQNVTYAIFGGSFDPPHLGHKEIIKKSLEIADYIIVVPTFLNPFKSSFSVEPKKRLKWVKKSFDFKNILVSSFEIEQKRAVYTIETFNELSKSYPIKYIIIGADNLKNIQKWKSFEALNSKITWIVATRSSEHLDTSKLNSFRIVNVSIDVSSSEIRSGKKLDYIDKNIKNEVINEYRVK
jgi:nicotinate-nucleotide adenylyltransferase